MPGVLTQSRDKKLDYLLDFYATLITFPTGDGCAVTKRLAWTDWFFHWILILNCLKKSWLSDRSHERSSASFLQARELISC